MHNSLKNDGPMPDAGGLRSREWHYTYRTSSPNPDGRPVDMLHDFYIPALSLAERYDRVAGYFRSSSLAAASQGFSAFVGRGGKMRLIVGADLQAADVQAILDGDRQRLEECLNDELASPHSWPVGVRKGVELLAWMVAHGCLEVRVAFRVHGDTKRPLSWESVKDGYVHEKWFILYDQFGQRLYGSGTLNESRTALVHNAENISVHCDWWGGRDRQRVEDAVVDFENLWTGHVLHMPVCTLPEAVRRRLIQIAETVRIPREVDAVEEPLPSAEERLRFALLADAPKMPGGRFVGINTAPVAPWPHQEVVVHRLVETWPYTYLLCDEVGLGKTIEAGLAFRSLYLSGLVKRILVAAPASLTQQWQRQMATKLLLSFGLTAAGSTGQHEYIFPETKKERSNSLYEPDLSIVSTGLLVRDNRIEELRRAEPFDIVLLDEAHAARRKNPAKGAAANPVFGNLYRVLRDHLRVKGRSLWLATATPMQIDPVEVCDLLALTNRAGAFQYDPTLILQYYELLSELIETRGLSNYEWAFLKRAINALKRQDPLLWRFIEQNVIDSRISMTVKQWLEYDYIPRGSDQELVQRLIFSASPLSRTMLRHNRRLLEIYRERGQLQENLPRREILAMPTITFNDLERDMYDRLESYCTGLSGQIQKHGDAKTRHAIGFLLSFFRLRFASSLFAFHETIKRRLAKVEATLQDQLDKGNGDVEEADISLEDLIYEDEAEDDTEAVKSLLKNRTPADLQWEKEQLLVLLSKLTNLTGPSTKMLTLLRVLDQRAVQGGRFEQTVIFTRFYDTLVDIVRQIRLVKPQILIGTYSGKGGELYEPDLKKMTAVNREEVKERFLRNEFDLLVCTDAAAEGLNLQTADLLINFDLGWNPMKVEQRIGRIDRIGQKNEKIAVLNLCYSGSAEETVYGRLLNRLKQANLIVGTQQFSMLPVTPEEFKELSEGSLTPEDLFDLALQKMKEQRKRAENMEISPENLYDIYMRLAEVRKSIPTPLGLPEIWHVLSRSGYLKDLGCAIHEPVNGSFVLTLAGITGVPAGTALTISRQLFEEGVPGVDTQLRFASYGEPAFETILKQVGKHELPPCARRISIDIPALEGVNLVGYAAACYSPEGRRITKLITKWSDLENLELAENEVLNDLEIEPLREKLISMARGEFDHYGAAARIERANVQAARSQELLNYLVIQSLIRDKAEFFGENPLFWPVLDDVEKIFSEREQVQVIITPADALRTVSHEMLFNIELPRIGEQAYVKITRVLGKTACDAGRRQATDMKIAKAKLTARSVLMRLEREVARKLSQIKA